MNKLGHLAFIMDGNNRWAKKTNNTKYYSYKYGAKKILTIADKLFKSYKLNEISAFALSTHNLKRPKSILKIIENILVEFLDSTLKGEKLKYKINFLGNLNFLNKEIIDKIRLIEKNNSNKKQRLNLFINYSGQEDILNSINQFLKKKEKFSKFTFEKYLCTNNLPMPDILIRTGGFNRISDFMLYEIAFTELFFLNKLWPEINITDVKKIIHKFHRTERKFGI